jgi:hypothetical protein
MSRSTVTATKADAHLQRYLDMGPDRSIRGLALESQRAVSGRWDPDGTNPLPLVGAVRMGSEGETVRPGGRRTSQAATLAAPGGHGPNPHGRS